MCEVHTVKKGSRVFSREKPAAGVNEPTEKNLLSWVKPQNEPFKVTNMRFPFDLVSPLFTTNIMQALERFQKICLPIIIIYRVQLEHLII